MLKASLTFLLALSATLLAALPASAQETPAEIVKEYIEVVVNGRQFDRIDEFIAEDLIQRNPNLPNGREPLKAFWTEFMGSRPEAQFTIGRVIAEGNLVAEHSLFRETPDDQGVAVVDIYRVEDGLIVEHWDVVQFLPDDFVSVSGNHPVLEELDQ